MAFLARSLLAGLMLLAAACSGSDGAGDNEAASDGPVGQEAGTYQPRLVLQFGHSSPISAVAWINGADNLVSIDQKGGILIWDVENRLILDHAQVPQWDEYMSLFAIEPQEDPHRLSLIYTVYEPHPDLHIALTDICPGEGLRQGQRCTFTFDLESRTVEPDGSIALPDLSPTGPPLQHPNLFPISPDGKWWPEQFRPVDQVDPSRGIQHIPEPGDHPGLNCSATNRCDYGIMLNPVHGPGESITLAGQERNFASDVDISSDGRQLVRLDTIYATVFTRSLLSSIDLSTREAGLYRLYDDAYSSARWIDDERVVLLGRGYNRYGGDLYESVIPPSRFRGLDSERTEMAQEEQQDEFSMLDHRAFAPARVIGGDCLAAGNCAATPSYYAMELIDDRGDYIGAGDLTACDVELGDVICEDGGSPMADGISRFSAATGTWQLMAQPDWGEEEIVALRLSPTRERLAVLTREGDPVYDGRTLRLRLLAIHGNQLETVGPPLFEKLYEVNGDYGGIFLDGGNDVDAEELLRFTPDGSAIVISHFLHADLPNSATGYEIVVVSTDGSAQPRRLQGHSRTLIPFAGHDRVFELESGAITDLATGETVATVRDKPILRSGGWIEESNLLWGAGEDGRIQFWDAASGALVLTYVILPDNRFFAMTPGGRYDTDLGSDAAAVRWSVLDQPWESLAPQTFMRDFYEPGLYARLLACRAENNCSDAFRRLPAFDRVNRVLPTVEIVDIARDGEAAVQVTVEAREGRRNGSGPSSGIYGLRLFRDNRLVAVTPRPIQRPQPARGSWQDTVERWRSENSLAEDGVYRETFTVPLPRSDDLRRHVFSAYAFNEDRIKSETAFRALEVDGFRPGPPRAFVINIGINAYDLRDLRLNYAAADARLLATRLAQIPGYEMRQLTLTAEAGVNGARPAKVTRAMILDAIGLVTGDSDGRELAREGIDASMLERATPDDVLILSFSGHGWADSQGNFYLLPSNARSVSSDEDRQLLLSAADLSQALQTNQAGEIALVIDACFSSAIVESGGFRPGPMGDAGLGQLAYDKGILILAASQADSYAIEDARLSHGLVTYALAGPGEGLSLASGADRNGDSSIRLDEWLAYAVARLPQLSRDRTVGRFDARSGSLEDIAPSTVRSDYIQRPSLFNFNPGPSPLVLVDPYERARSAPRPGLDP